MIRDNRREEACLDKLKTEGGMGGGGGLLSCMPWPLDRGDTRVPGEAEPCHQRGKGGGKNASARSKAGAPSISSKVVSYVPVSSYFCSGMSSAPLCGSYTLFLYGTGDRSVPRGIRYDGLFPGYYAVSLYRSLYHTVVV